MKELLSEAGQCLVYGIIFVLLTRGILWNSLYQNMVELL